MLIKSYSGDHGDKPPDHNSLSWLAHIQVLCSGTLVSELECIKSNCKRREGALFLSKDGSEQVYGPVNIYRPVKTKTTTASPLVADTRLRRKNIFHWNRPN